MNVEIGVPLATVFVLAVVLTFHHLRVSKLRRQENAIIHKRREVTPPLLRQGEPSDF